MIVCVPYCLRCLPHLAEKYLNLLLQLLKIVKGEGKGSAWGVQESWGRRT